MQGPMVWNCRYGADDSGYRVDLVRKRAAKVKKISRKDMSNFQNIGEKS